FQLALDRTHALDAGTRLRRATARSRMSTHCEQCTDPGVGPANDAVRDGHGGRGWSSINEYRPIGAKTVTCTAEWDEPVAPDQCARYVSAPLSGASMAVRSFLALALTAASLSAQTGRSALPKRAVRRDIPMTNAIRRAFAAGTRDS